MAGTSVTAERVRPPVAESAIVATPFGCDLFVACDGDYVTESRFVARSRTRSTQSARSMPRTRQSAALRAAVAEIDTYLSRALVRFEVPFAFAGTPLQIAVWETVSRLPFGMLVSYADIARAIGRPGAARGVASALAKTPLAIFVPAHRVVGADGRIKGAGPRSMRRRLLAFEGITIR
jgi:O-6-methylguanine DNA methyltransferase